MSRAVRCRETSGRDVPGEEPDRKEGFMKKDGEDRSGLGRRGVAAGGDDMAESSATGAAFQVIVLVSLQKRDDIWLYRTFFQSARSLRGSTG